MSEQDSNSGARPAEPDQRRSPLRVDVAWLGAAGVALYVMLRIPFAIFYDKFGTSPEEVGLGYVQLLAQSSLLVAIVAAAASAVTLNRHFGFYPLPMGFLVDRSAKWNGGGREVLAQMPDGDFASYLERARRANDSRKLSRQWMREELENQARIRDLDRKGVLNKAESKERRRLLSGVGVKIHRTVLGFVYELEDKRRRFISMFVLWSLGIMVIGLPILAATEGRIVRDCGTADNIAGMSYSGTKVKLLDSKTLDPRFPERNLLLLGGDSNRYVLFDCTDDTTLRLPTSDYVVLHGGQ